MLGFHEVPRLEQSLSIPFLQVLHLKSIVPGTAVIDAGVSIANANWSTPVLSNDGKTLTFDLGDVTNSNASNDLKGFSIEYEAVVLNVASNKAAKTLKNAAETLPGLQLHLFILQDLHILILSR